MTIGSVLLLWVVFAAIGAFLGSTVKKVEMGFFLGLLLGPIGWIIVLLLPRESPEGSNSGDSQEKLKQEDPLEKSTNSSRPERDLTRDAYKIWLVENYEVKKNDVFEKYICNEKLFETLDEALAYADALEAEKRSRDEINADREQSEREEEERRRKLAAEERALRRAESDKKFTFWFSWIGGLSIVVTIAILVYWTIS